MCSGGHRGNHYIGSAPVSPLEPAPATIAIFFSPAPLTPNLGPDAIWTIAPGHTSGSKPDGGNPRPRMSVCSKLTSYQATFGEQRVTTFRSGRSVRVAVGRQMGSCRPAGASTSYDSVV